MKYVQLIAAAVMAIAMVGCGGSGGRSSNSGNAAISSTPRVEAVVQIPTTYDTVVGANGQTYTFFIQDPRNIEAQDQVQFQLVNYTTVGTTVTRNILTTNYWVSSDSSNTYGTLGYDTGDLQAGTNQTNANLTVTTYYNGQRYSTVYRILPRQVRVRGQLLSDDTNVPLAGVEVDFYGPSDPSNPLSGLIRQGVVITAYDGTFRASIPGTVTTFQLANQSLPSGYQRYFRYTSNYYQTGNANCQAPITVFPNETNGERYLIDFTNPDVTSNGTILLLSNQESVPTVNSSTCTLQ